MNQSKICRAHCRVEAKDILLDFCVTARAAERIKSMSETQLAECLFHNTEAGLIPSDELTDDLCQWMDEVLNEAS